MLETQSGQVLIVGDGLAGTSLATTLAHRGMSTTILAPPRDADRPPTQGWQPVLQGQARRLPPGVVLEPSLPLDLILAGEHRIETAGRIALVDSARLRAVWRRRARAAGAEIRPARARSALRHSGRVGGVRLQDGTDLAAPLTVDASGTGVLLGALPGSLLPGGRYGRHEREAVAVARVPFAPDRIQSSWVGRAQLLLGLSRPGALGWRCTPRRGDQVFVAITAGPGAGRSVVEGLLAEVLGPDAPEATALDIRWLPCRRPLDMSSVEGLLVVGSAAAAIDTLLGMQLPVITAATGAIGRALVPPDPGATPTTAGLFPVSRALQRCVGGGLSLRQFDRRMWHALDVEQREALVMSGALGPGSWASAAAGGALVDPGSVPRAALGGLARPLFRRLVRHQARRVALWRLHRRYPSTYDMFEQDAWQSRVEALFCEEER